MNPDLIQASLNMLTGLAVVVGLLLLSWVLIKRFVPQNLGTGRGKHVEVLGQTCVGLKKSISLVKVPGSILVLGVTQDRITLLNTISRDDWPGEVEKKSGAAERPASSFLSQLKREIITFPRKNGKRSPSA